MIRSTATRVVIVSLCAMSSTAWTTGALADEYQDQIAKAFAGFEILARSDFTEQIRTLVKTANPALVKGRFNSDQLEDFAAIILDRSAQYGQQGEGKYYLGKYVVCHGAGKGRYQCRILKEERIHLPYQNYLQRVSPGKLECTIDKDLNVAEITLQRDAIRWGAPDGGSGVYIYQPDGTYSECDEPFD